MKLALVLVGSLLGCGTSEVADDSAPPDDVQHVGQAACSPTACPDPYDVWTQNFYSDASMTTQVGYRRCICGTFWYSGQVTAYSTYTLQDNICSAPSCP